MSREISAGSSIRVVKVRVMGEENGTIRMKGKQVAAIGDESGQWRHAMALGGKSTWRDVA